MEQIEENEQTLATVHALLRAEGMGDAASIVRDYPAQVELTGHDNWNGGTNILEFQFKLPAQDYARLAEALSAVHPLPAAMSGPCQCPDAVVH
jgi:hypothetical protein